MQLKSNKSIRSRLALASCSLLSAVNTGANAAAADGNWQVDSAILGYSETDRVQVIEPVISVTRKLGEEDSIEARVVYDSMTGASPNGASPSDQPQTFTTPSGLSTYSTEANKTPMRDFEDQRTALTVTWNKTLARTLKGIFGGTYSSETDYQSLGLNSSLALDVNDRLTTITAGVGASFDRVEPDGGVPAELLAYSTIGSGGEDDEKEGGGASKRMVDALFGVTQVINRRMLVQLNYAFASQSGYLNDPYKIVSMVDGTTGETLDYYSEKRPDTRQSNSIFLKGLYHFNRDVMDLSYRYFTDDWGIRSHTVDLHYRYELSRGMYLRPHFRWYKQTAADFYRHSFRDNEPLPENVSADYRLAEFTGTTLGLKFGMPWGRHGDISFRVERLMQTGDSNPSDAVGLQQQQDLYPDLEAWIVQLGVSKRF